MLLEKKIRKTTQNIAYAPLNKSFADLDLLIVGGYIFYYKFSQ